MNPLQNKWDKDIVVTQNYHRTVRQGTEFVTFVNGYIGTEYLALRSNIKVWLCRSKRNMSRME